MNALDTNVLARFFIDDEDDVESLQQRPAAIAAMSQKGFVSITVILEFEWVMRGFYSLPRKDIKRVFESLCGLTNIYIESRDTVLRALNCYHSGLDFADALHLACAKSCESFLSFDDRLRKRSNALGLEPLVLRPKA
jgi:predicted nucleic-acid-binding protein